MADVQIIFNVTSNADQPSATLMSALSSIGDSAVALQSQLDSLSASAQNAAAGLEVVASASQTSAGQVETMGTSAQTAAGDLDTVGKSAQEAGKQHDESGKKAGEHGKSLEGLAGAGQVAGAGLNTAATAAGAFGIQVGPAVEVSNIFKEALGSLTEGVAGFAVGLGVAGAAVLGLTAVISSELVEKTQEWGMELYHLSERSGMTVDSLAGMQVRLEEVGLSGDSASRSITFLARQMETLATAAETDARTAIEDQKKLAETVAEAQAHLREAYGETVAAIHEATENEKSNLDDLAEKHAETVEKIKATIATLAQDYAESEADRKAKFEETEADRVRTAKEKGEDRRDGEKETLSRMAQEHDDHLTRITNAEARAHTLAASQKAVEDRVAENNDYARAVERVQQRLKKDEADAAEELKRANEKATKKLADEEAAAAKQYAKKQAALEAALAEEDKAYAKQVAKEEERYSLQIKRLNDQYAKEERANAEHIDKMNRSAAEKEPGGGSAGESPFEIELRKMLTYAGLTATEIDEKMKKIKDGEASVGDVLPDVAEGFRRQNEEAEAAGVHLNQAGEAAKLFGRNGAEMLPFLRQGGEAFKEDAALAEYFGLAVGEEGSKKIREYTKAQADMNAMLKGITVTLGVELMPTFTKWAKFVEDWVHGNREEIIGFAEDFGNRLKDLGTWVAEHHEEIEDFLAGVWHIMQGIGQWVEDNKVGIQSFFLLLSIAVKLMWLQAEAPFVALKAVFSFLSDWYHDHKDEIGDFFGGVAEKFGTMKDTLDRAWGPTKKVLDEVWETLKKIADIIDRIMGFDPTDAVKGAAKKVVGAAGDAVDKAKDLIPGVPGFDEGLDYVPYDDFLARLHKGEKVQTAAEAEADRSGRGGRNAAGNLTVNFLGTVNLGEGLNDPNQLGAVGLTIRQALQSKGLGF